MSNLKDFLIKLHKNLNILREREAKYAAAAPLELLNQIEDYEQAISLTEQAIAQDIPLDQLQAQLSGFNLRLDMVVFVTQEPPRLSFTGRNPYRGLRKFTETEAEFFFGRTEAIHALVTQVAELVGKTTSRAEPELIAMLGASGSGKSSLVRAGLIPALRSGQVPRSERWPIKVILPGFRPLEALAEVFLNIIERSLAAILSELTQSEKAFHHLVVEAMQGQPDGARFVLVIDQFEELFTLCEDDKERQTFLDLLLYACQIPRNRAFIILTMRADFYAKASVHKNLAQIITKNQMLVSPMTERELREAILLPAEAVGLELEKDLVQALVHDTVEAPGALPLLQHALDELFRRRDGHLLTMHAYREIGGIRGAVAHRADAVMEEFTPEQHQTIRRIFLRLIQPGEGTLDSRRRATFEEIQTQTIPIKEVEAIVQTLADANLLITDRNFQTNQMVLDVAHEALIQEWPTLRQWVEEGRQGLRIRQHLSQATRDWTERRQDEGSLYRGARLLEVQEWVVANPGETNSSEQAFLEASIEARDREVAERKRQTQRIIGGLTIGLIFLIIAAVFGFMGQNQAIAQANLALSRQLAAQALTNLDTQFDRALLLSLESNRINDTVEARNSLLAGMVHQSQLITFLHGHTTAVLSVAFSSNRKMLASGSADKTIRLWDVASGQPLGVPFTGHTAQVHSVAFSPDGKTLASGSSDGTVRLWELLGHSYLGVKTLISLTDKIFSVAFSPDGKTLAVGSGDKAIRLWDMTSGKYVGLPLTGHNDAVYSLAFSPNGKTLASGSWDKTIRLWDVTRGQLIGLPLTGHTAAIDSVAFSSNGKILASGSVDKTIRLWDVASGQPLGVPFTGHTAQVHSVAFSPDGKTLASGSWDQTIRLWDVTSGQPIGLPLTDYTDAVYSLAFSPDGKTLASASLDNIIRLWNISSNQRLGKVQIGQPAEVHSLAFSPDGKILALGSWDKTIRLWDVTRSQPLKKRIFTGHTAGVWSVAFSPDGKILASGSEDKTVRLWDVASGQQVGNPLIGHTAQVHSVAFSPSSKILASGSADETIQLWDVASGQPIGPPLTGHTDIVFSIAFSPDGKTLASGSRDKTVRLWDVANGQLIGFPLIGYIGDVTGVTFSPDGKTLATASADKTILLWDIARQQPIGPPLTGHTDTVISVAFSPDGKTIASGSADRTIRLWDVTGGQPLGQPLTGHTDQVYSVVFSPDGKTLASGSWDKTIRLWDIDFQSWQVRACRIANRNLTKAEWDQFIGTARPYERTCPDLPANE